MGKGSVKARKEKVFRSRSLRSIHSFPILLGKYEKRVEVTLSQERSGKLKRRALFFIRETKCKKVFLGNVILPSHFCRAVFIRLRTFPVSRTWCFYRFLSLFFFLLDGGNKEGSFASLPP